MQQSSINVIILMIAILIYVFSRRILLPALIKRDFFHRLWFKWKHPEIKALTRGFNAMYKQCPSFFISRKERRERNLIGDQYVYGEIDFISFACMLEAIQPKKNEIFYDLGSGS